MYKIQNYVSPNGEVKNPCAVIRLENASTIPFDPANTDYQQFKTDIKAGGELLDAEGNVMTQEAATAFIGTLP